ncbi:MAG: anthranilate phosphoribosyltransferase [Alphaproteobacteria bacterium]|jgi:anthranilate phosphoribosyltransferase|nr:anthranilate phosphoribosyltransferase [Alphaproteobacteria bacterium]MBT5828435.1 anthranilate phosphoribosyltransferase [Alphaproteobacteria bacterium]
MKDYLTKLQENQTFSESELKNIFLGVLEQKYTKEEIAAFLFGLSFRGESSEEIYSLVSLLKSKANKFASDLNAIDVCGTGGDGHNSLNISTAVAFTLSSLGVKVVKHGNKAISSKSGSSDVLAKLGVDITATPEIMKTCLKKHNFCFLFAPYYHQAIKQVAEIRNSLKVRTIFNLIGPLLNPANLNKQLIGVYDLKLMDKYADILLKLNYEHAFIVSSIDGLDEVSISAKTNIIEIISGKKHFYTFDPKTLLNNNYKLSDLKGGDADYNALKMLNLFKGEEGAYHDAVCLNAAFGLKLQQKDKELKECFHIIKNKLLTGEVYKHFLEIRNIFK